MSGIDYRDAATGLRIVEEPYPNGVRARAVYRGAERIYHAYGVDDFMKGYRAAKAEPVEDLVHDPRVSDAAIKEAYFALLAEEGVL